MCDSVEERKETSEQVSPTLPPFLPWDLTKASGKGDVGLCKGVAMYSWSMLPWSMFSDYVRVVWTTVPLYRQRHHHHRHLSP